MSRVFLATENKLGRKVVVKVLAPELAAGIDAERFQREIRVAASLQQANIVPLLTAGETDGLPYFTMPFVDGLSLRARMSKSGPLPVAECIGILRDVARALSYAHEHGVAHRDIKPDNILLSQGAAVVTDFGIAKALSTARGQSPTSSLTALGTSLGTPAYMAPEQAAGDPNVDHRADIYAVGIVGYEMLAGHPPFTGTPQNVMAAHITAPPPALAATRSDVTPALERLIAKCLAKSPADRCQSAHELLAELDAVATPAGGLSASGATTLSPRARRIGVPLAIVLVVAVAWFGTGRVRRERWAHDQALPGILRLAEAGQSDSAYALAVRAAAILPNDSLLNSLWPRFSRKDVFHSKPEGAKVYRASFDDTTHWFLLGTTPTDSVRFSSGVARFRIEKPGLVPFDGIGPLIGVPVVHLDSAGAGHESMSLVTGGTFAAFLVGNEAAKPLELGDFLMDKYEVTNKEYKAFVDAGGYTKRDFWESVTGPDGRPMTWEAAMSRFTDKTGRPGPATWEAGDFPSGQADFPVSGVSWYEASAYAKFTGKSLPTIYHWARAADVRRSRYVVPGSNLAGTGPAPSHTARGRSAWGVFDMAGNVREWCVNATDSGDERFILGGGWSDPVDAFVDSYAQPALDRSVINGIRLVKYLGTDPNVALASRPQVHAFRDYTREKPVADAVFQSFKSMYDYDHTPLHSKVESSDTTQEEWNVERVSFDAAYGNERMSAWLFLPKHGKPPYQTVVFYPGGGAIAQPSSMQRRDMTPSFVVKSGRAFVLPIYKSTYERQDTLRTDVADSTILRRDHVVMWAKDYRRTLDYLSTRADVDTSKFAYFGFSWGGNLGGLIPAIEPRIKTVVLYVAGLEMGHIRQEADPLNFLPHIRVPVLMLNGKYDFFFPIETAQKPFFKLLGSPADQKRYVVYEGGHDVPRTQLISETLAWLDKYLGPVR
jgi:serine/threonine protein kinase/dienelactone hydrolase